ncbi:DUF2007 domain-containing protein [Cellulophaga sp. 20_2_10]|uniref:putative signal transducing protein n=1 Tax=Cellulophaga sp. 20_2_10 TaxID=2942476 RepID=UPI00201A37B9|nr:DUF2007 domain-containing protein [Cellulophaga sp. 20_2_10]MCL5246757.1 DUF2007 domain-containing protein [Cellulophaga sp. 20_2_10]
MSQKFYRLAAFEYLADTVIIKGRLESEGIEVFLKDENTVNSDPLISNAIGGIKILVLNEDKDKAIKIYNEIRSYAVGDNGQPLICPNCKAEKLEGYYSGNGIFYRLFPFFEKRKFRCFNCNIVS